MAKLDGSKQVLQAPSLATQAVAAANSVSHIFSMFTYTVLVGAMVPCYRFDIIVYCNIYYNIYIYFGSIYISIVCVVLCVVS